MGLPAVMLPGPLLFPGLPPEDRKRIRADWEPRWSALRDEIRKSRPAEGTPDEREALRRFLRLLLELAGQVGPSFTGLVPAALGAGLGELVRREIRAKQPQRRFAMRMIARALDTLGVLAEFLGAAAATIMQSTDGSRQRPTRWLTKLAGRKDLPVDSEAALLLRWQLSLFVAMDLLDGPVDELAYWSQHAVAGARRVDALMLAHGSPFLRGELARARAKGAWENWDDEEVRRELSPWPTRA